MFQRLFRRSITLINIAVMIAVMVMLAPCAYARTPRQGDADAARIPRIRQTVYRAGEGPGARVVVTLRDKKKLKGYIRASGEDHLTLRNADDGTTTRVEYANIETIKTPVRFSFPPALIRPLVVVGAIGITAAIIASQSSRERPPSPVFVGTR
ncbi:MAG: hypothetical protein ACKV2V_02050 [Blastocatellia bacterium]